MMIFLFIIVPRFLSSHFYGIKKIVMVEIAIYHKRQVAKVFLFFPLFEVGGDQIKYVGKKRGTQHQRGFPLIL